MIAKTALTQNSRFKVGWILLVVFDVLMAVSHFALIFFLDEPNLFIGFTLFNLYALLVIWFPFRQGEKWAWIATWLLPVGLTLPAASDPNIAVYYFGASAACGLALFLTRRDFFPKG